MERASFKPNFQPDVKEDWDHTRASCGGSHTKFAMIGLAAVHLLPEALRKDLAWRVTRCAEDKTPWLTVMEWVRGKEVAARLADTLPRPSVRTRMPAKRKSGSDR